MGLYTLNDPATAEDILSRLGKPPIFPSDPDTILIHCFAGPFLTFAVAFSKQEHERLLTRPAENGYRHVRRGELEQLGVEAKLL